ncbi:MAG: transglycosylase domain-containing protein [Patescibacteria group bacterium]
MKIKLRIPKIRNPFANPINLKKLQRQLFSRKTSRKIAWRRVGKYALWSTGGFILLIILMFAWFAKDLPTPGKIRNLAAEGSTRLFDRNMQPLYTISGEKKRILIDQKDIPQVIKDATIAIEDKNFYSHHGIYLKGIGRAIIFGGSRGGGSTITQQFVKNAILKDNKHNLVRKVKEAILSIELEALYSKEQILTLYLNEIPYGGSNYGIEAAAKSYFNKSAKDLTIAEAATLAALPQAPSTLSPYGQNIDRLIARRDLTISLMVEQGYITGDQATEAKKVEPKFAPRRDSITAPHFVLFVKDWLVTYFTKELGDAQVAEQKVESGGFDVVTTLDLPKQQEAERIVSAAAGKTLKNAGASNAALVTIDPKRGEVIAMVGSVDYFQEQFGAFNVATASRQPGSSFKPIVYSAAFKEKYNPATTLFDLRTDFGKYIPDNFDGGFRGPVTIRQALGNSLNIPAVKILGLVGIDDALKNASDLGITTLTDKDRYGLSLVLGGGEVKLTEMTTAYGVFAAGGVLMPTTPILKITDSKQKVIYTHEDPKDGRQVLDPQIAYQISNVLSDVEAKKPTFGRTLGVLTLQGRPAASKTGTTDAFRDAWTMGYTPQYVTGVWAGNNDNTSMNRAGGSVAAAPIWDAFMEYLHKDLPVEQFSRPAGIRDVTVDRLSNKLPVDGSETITDIFASWQVPTEKDDVHVRVRVCKENGLLADASIPDELTEDRTYTNIHSEKPNNPNWEGPVLAWANANGFNNRPPTEKCQAGNVQPSVEITSPTNDQEVTGQFTISVSASAPSGVRQVELTIDNISIGVITSSPYQMSYNAGLLADGDHKLQATVTSNNGSSATSGVVNFIVISDHTPPSEVSSLIGLTGGGQIVLSWINPTDIDFQLVRIKIYSGAPGYSNLYRTVEVAKPGKTVTIGGLSGTLRFMVHAVDNVGNQSDGIERYYSF